MDNLYNFIITICFTYSFVFIFKKIAGDIRFDRFKEVKYVIAISIFDFILTDLTIKSFKLGVYYILLEISIYLLCKEKKLEFFIYYILTFWIFQVSDICIGLIINSSVILANILKKDILLGTFLPQIMVMLIATLLAIIVSNIKNANKTLNIKENKLFWIYVNIIIVVYMRLIYYYNNTANTQNIIIISIIVLCFFLFISYFMFTVLNRLYMEKNARTYIEIYNSIIEESLDNMNIYKHDQKNILLSIGGFLDNNDIKGLKEYFYENIAKNQYTDSKNLYGIINIQNSPVKGLLYAKIAKATSKQVNLYINIKNIIESFIIKDIDMCKILGILIDNGIEASAESNQRLLSVGIWNDESEVYVIVSNSFKQEPIIHKIFEKGYSTKGYDRGLGLSIARDLIEKKYSNMSINTKIEDNLFNVEVIIKK